MSDHSTSRSSSPLRKKHVEKVHHEPLPQNAIVPWFPCPMEGWNEETESFSPRHEASTIELFFDLWFVGNLATFTSYHAITNRYNFWSYVAFFMLLWTSWFHVVCFDARFTSDSVWERACKAVHFCSFAAFALAGYKFQPLAADPQAETPHWMYRTMCFAILLSRGWLSLQYLVTAIMCTSRKHRKLRLTLPLALNALLFLCTAAVFGGLFAGFSNIKKDLTGVLIGAYVTLAVEFIGSLTISMIWHKVSFKSTHISERMGLLGLIIIGEGVIGTTKTIVRTMGKNGPTYDASAQIFCIIMILLFMWILYFDRVPLYRFGVVKQQIWMALHLPYHLAVLGVVEGCQQLAQAHYIYYCTAIMMRKALNACNKLHLDGQALSTSLYNNIKYFKLDESPRGTLALKYVWDEIYILGNTTGVCSPSNTTNTPTDVAGLPMAFWEFVSRSIGAMFQAFDNDIPPEGDIHTVNIALQSWVVVYTYFWSAILLLLACFTIMSLLAEEEEGGKGNWRFLRRYVGHSVLSRIAMIALAVVLLVIGRQYPPHHIFVQEYIASSWLLPTVVLAFWIVCLSDRLSKLVRHRKGRKTKYESVASMDKEENTAQGSGDLRRRGTNAYGYPSH